ncbi:hypothetical protein BK260_26305 [Escherichia coli]|nr:hypothetical protein BK244_02000 [Escherichia coli]OJL28434.1 hypothetical protein BK260_26305 [Escherichia coli]OJL61501.1 hypothetical protein BK267_26755 [Escherichia coli]OJL92820.1 hypothetical protein BK270_01810 [Escherichia coli]
MFAGKKSAQIREILISESTWEEMTCLFAPSLDLMQAGVTPERWELDVLARGTTIIYDSKKFNFPTDDGWS